MFELHLKDLINGSFFDLLEDLVKITDCGTYDFTHARGIHADYVQAQSNLEWLDIIDKFKQTGTVDPRVEGSTMYQSFLLEEMMPRLKNKNIPWKTLGINECIQSFQRNDQ